MSEKKTPEQMLAELDTQFLKGLIVVMAAVDAVLAALLWLL